jgi:hypothetical protein
MKKFLALLSILICFPVLAGVIVTTPATQSNVFNGPVQMSGSFTIQGNLFSLNNNGELMLTATNAGLNVIVAMNTNPNGYTGFTGRSNLGIEHFTLGWGNMVGGHFGQLTYLECSDLSTVSGTTQNQFSLVQTSARPNADAGRGGYSNERITIGSDLGDISLTSFDLVDASNTTYVFGAQGMTMIQTGTGTSIGKLIGTDPATGIHFRDTVDFGSSVNKMIYASYGDTFATGGGHIFTVGGPFPGSQTVRMQLSTDVAMIDAAGDGNASIFLRESGSNHNDYYSFGGTSAAGMGHRFYTGGAKASQTLRMKISDDMTTNFGGVTTTGFTHTQGFGITAPAVPSTSSSAGGAGDIAWDANFIYVCVATNTWKRVAIATW